MSETRFRNKFVSLQILVFLVCDYVVLHSGAASECTDPNVDVAPTLDPFGAKDFNK